MNDVTLSPEKSTASLAYPNLRMSETVFRMPSKEEVEIGKGTGAFDAIFQFNQTYLTNELKRSLSSKPYILEKKFIYDDSLLSAATKQAIDSLVINANAKTTSPTKASDKGFSPKYFRISAKNPRILLLQADPDLNVWTGCSSQVRTWWISEVADMYPACLIGSRAVALMGVRTRRWSH